MAEKRTAGEVDIREFRIEDYDRVIELWKEGGLPLKPEGRDARESIARQVQEPCVGFIVAEERGTGRVVGTVLATHDGRKGWINRLAVDPAWRRRGIGARLVRDAEHWLEARGMGILACLIEEDNPLSMTVFEKLGYREHPEIHYFAKRKTPGA